MASNKFDERPKTRPGIQTEFARALVACSQKELPLMILRWIQATQIDSFLKNSSQINLLAHVLFQRKRFLTPSPPSDVGVMTVSHDTLAIWRPSSDPFHKRGSQLKMDNFLVQSGRPR